MSRIGVMFGSLCVVGLVSPVWALKAVKPLDGYICMSLKADQKYNDWVPGSLPKKPGGPDNPPVYKEPTPASQQLGYTGSPVIVQSPLDEVNGYVRVLWGQKGVPGWVEGALLIPYHSFAVPSATCTPYLMDNGNIGFK